MVDAGGDSALGENPTAQAPNRSPVNVAFTCDDRGTVGLAVAVHSLLRHTKRLVNVWIIEEGIDFATRHRLEASWSDSPNLTKVTFISHTDLPIKVPSWWATNKWPLTACYRFQIAEILPPTVHRFVYLDIDVLVGTDIGILYDLDMKGFPIAMVDGFMKNEADRQYIISLGLNPEHYGNPGVMLIDVDAWRSENHAVRLIDHARTMRPNLWFFDQDMINGYFKDRFLLLEGRWNKRDAAALPHGVILHFAGRQKPWQMTPNESTHAGLVAWHDARAGNRFQSTPSPLPRRLKRRVEVRIARLQRQLRRLLSIIFLVGLAVASSRAVAQATSSLPVVYPPVANPATPAAALVARPPRPPNPTRDPHTPGYVKATELADGTVPSPTADGNFILGPTHNAAPEMKADPSVPKGTVYTFTMKSEDSKIYPGIARDEDTFGTPDPDDPTIMLVPTSHPAPYTRTVGVYVPKQYVPGTAAPFIVGADGIDRGLFTALDNLIAAHKAPVMIAISIGNGSGDAQGSERGLEYDTMSGKYAEFVETEVLPLVESQYHVKLTKDPDGRATMGGSSGGSCALIMAWYHPEWYHRVLTYSGTYVNQQWPHNAETPHGAWEFHEHLIPNSRKKPLRLWLEVGDKDNYNANTMRDNMHDWVVANENMAKALAAKGYHYQFVFARNAGHTDRATRAQTLPEALEYLWQGYPIAGAKK